MPEPVPTSRHAIAGADDALHGCETEARAGMLAGAALHTGIDFEAKAAGGRGLGAPGRYHEEFLAD